MSDVTETLQELMERRLRELGQRRGRGESISLHEAYERLLQVASDRARESADDGGPSHPAPPTYEVFRRIRNGHTKITDATADALATMLDVPLGDVHRAIGVRPLLGRFELPTRADRLDERERKVVVDVVDAILTAAEKDRGASRPGLRAVASSGDPEDAKNVEKQAREARRRQTGKQD